MNRVQLPPEFTPPRGSMPSILEQYRVAQFVEWEKQKSLEINTDFQRGNVWKPAARTMLIDTILRQYPIPKVYLRTIINVLTQRAVKEIVDGQQRIRAILDFAEDKFVLTKRAQEFKGMRYSDLTDEQKATFLSYPIGVDQLVNAGDEEVLEVFARLNSYTVSLNGAEKRHAKFQGEFKFAIRDASKRWSGFWKDYNILSTQKRVRMQDDALTAEMIGALLEGVKDGGDPKIWALYTKYDNSFDVATITTFDRVLRYLVENLAEALRGTPMLNPPHLLTLFSALAFILVGIPDGDFKPEEVAGLPRAMFSDLDQVRENLLLLAALIDTDDEPGEPLIPFWKASHSSTQRIASRRVRFPFYVRALGSDNVA
jgi:hypothetical protein